MVRVASHEDLVHLTYRIIIGLLIFVATCTICGMGWKLGVYRNREVKHLEENVALKERATQLSDELERLRERGNPYKECKADYFRVARDYNECDAERLRLRAELEKRKPKTLPFWAQILLAPLEWIEAFFNYLIKNPSI
jgi:hypothetical protein